MVPITLKSLPTPTTYIQSVSQYLIEYVLNNNRSLINLIEQSEKLPIPEIKKAVSNQFDLEQIVLFNITIIKELSETYPYDAYSKFFKQCGYDVGDCLVLFKRAVIQLTIRPLADAHLKLAA